MVRLRFLIAPVYGTPLRREQGGKRQKISCGGGIGFSQPPPVQQALSAVPIALGFTAVIILLLRQRPGSHKDEVLQRLRMLEEGLEADFTKATADMAARLEQVKGDLRLELADRLQGNFTQLRETVEKQLASGRSEQAQQLAQFAERQALGLRESRDDLARGLTQVSKPAARPARPTPCRLGSRRHSLTSVSPELLGSPGQPRGRMPIAQHLSAGLGAEARKVPEGTTKAGFGKVSLGEALAVGGIINGWHVPMTPIYGSHFRPTERKPGGHRRTDGYERLDKRVLRRK